MWARSRPARLPWPPPDRGRTRIKRAQAPARRGERGPEDARGTSRDLVDGGARVAALHDDQRAAERDEAEAEEGAGADAGVAPVEAVADGQRLRVRELHDDDVRRAERAAAGR